ncbi:hypothetical protein [Bacillus sp. AG4(2022)]|uniref:hypothetical protein n=1 Tax=Bacillus sp. AG4(2022) TaxID=2962594 RepID=UPI0028823DFB|nr:hypothetical protein [Bacillus sp. AG4(2022)]MDT0160427.1 hypothetical protein [Bacillus sp. AG4(2022)]
MNIQIEQVTFKNLQEVAYGSGTFSLYGENPKKVTVKFSVQVDTIYLNGFIELDQDEYFANASNLNELIKERISKSL